MAASFHAILLCSILLISSSSAAQTSFRPKALILPVTKDASTNQYITQLNQRTPLVPLSLTLDLGAKFLWVDCETSYSSSTYLPARCGSAQCSLANSGSCGPCYSSPSRPGCTNNTCNLFPENTITHTTSLSGDIGSDVVSLQSTNGKNPGKVVSIPNFLFVCAPKFLLDGLAKGVMGMAGLGRTKISLPSQFSSTFSFPKKFGMCLSSGQGVIFFGDGPYDLLASPNSLDASSVLSYTPLLINPVTTTQVISSANEPSSDYFIGVKSIKVGQKVVPINTTLLTIDKQGNGGTMISTVTPYTTLETSIYKAVVKAFADGLEDAPRVASVAPFGACFNSTNIHPTRLGYAVPEIDLVLQNESVWQIFGESSVVQVRDDVLCLGFLDGGLNPRTSIVIGGYQMEEMLLQFDLAQSRLGFSPVLSAYRTTCANFNFTSNA